jgi:hypothetical protein
LIAKPKAAHAITQLIDLSDAGGKADDDAHRPRRIGLRFCDARDTRESGSTYVAIVFDNQDGLARAFAALELIEQVQAWRGGVALTGS